MVQAVSTEAALTSRAAALEVVDFAAVAAGLDRESRRAWLPAR
jgi:hypothetical protein